MKVVFAHDHRFVHVGEQYFSKGGLPAKVLERYTAVFDEVRVVSRQVESATSQGLSTASAKRVSFAKVPDVASLRGLLQYRQAINIVEHEVADCDAVIARLPSEVGQIAFRTAQRLGKPVLVEVVGSAWGSVWHHSLRGKLVAPVSYLRARRAVRDAPFVLYITDSYLQRRYPTKGRWVSCANVDLDVTTDGPLVTTSGQMNKAGGQVLVGSCGAVNVRAKGHHLMVEAIPRLIKRGYDVRYEIVGGGDPAPLIALAAKLGVSDRIALLGNKPHPQVLEWMRTLDLYLQPSLSEGQGRALLEAMGAGCACVSADVEGMQELMPRRFRFRRGDVGSLCDSVMYALSNLAMCRNDALERAKDFERASLDERRQRFFQDFRLWIEGR
ncbi:MAG: glycosyltransferase family 4 protein [Propionibacteriaceae bacterium]|nr:glycosyltransferase family 4 protein [Propionibacteriaceae bacterium]